MLGKLFALLYLRSDSTTVPLAAAKLSCPRDASKKVFFYKNEFYDHILKR